jgi:hypothetical protein
MALIGFVLFLTMPAVEYVGDSCVIRDAAFYLLKTGNAGIPYADRDLVVSRLTERGQFFFENDEKERLFSKYGVANSILFLPPLIVKAVCSGEMWRSGPGGMTLPSYSDRFIFVLNVYNILIALWIVFYLYQLLRLYTARQTSILVFLFSAFFGAFLWNYLRAQTPEIFQVCFFLGYFYHLVMFRRLTDSVGSGARKVFLHLLLSGVYAAMLTLMKLYYVFLFPAAILFLACAAWKSDRAKSWQWRNYGKAVVYFLLLPAIGAVILAGALQQYQFGSWLETGYGQWQSGGMAHDRFSVSNMPAAIYGLLGSIDKSCIIHFPLLGFALFGYMSFQRRYPLETGLMAGLFVFYVLLISGFSNWSGDICYGPRYLLFLLPVVSLPFVAVVDWLTSGSHWRRRWALALLVAVSMLFSCRMQVAINSLHFFTINQVSALLQSWKLPEIRAYFHDHRSLISSDIIAFKRGHRPFYPVEVLRARLVPGKEGNFDEFESGIRQNIQWNYLLLKKLMPVQDIKPIRMHFAVWTDSPGE